MASAPPFLSGAGSYLPTEIKAGGVRGPGIPLDSASCPLGCPSFSTNSCCQICRKDSDSGFLSDFLASSPHTHQGRLRGGGLGGILTPITVFQKVPPDPSANEVREYGPVPAGGALRSLQGGAPGRKHLGQGQIRECPVPLTQPPPNVHARDLSEVKRTQNTRVSGSPEEGAHPDCWGGGE